jgi:sugar lactone lactonase YvrE
MIPVAKRTAGVSPWAGFTHGLTPAVLGAFVVLLSVASGRSAAAEWLLSTAYKLPSEYTNQESGYFSIIEGHNRRLYIGAAKYGVDAYLLEFDPKAGSTRMVLDVHSVIGSSATGFAAQAKIHTRNNVGASGKIYVGSKQGYPEKGENRDLYRGGYVLTYDPATGRAEHFGIPKAGHGVISVMPDESRGKIYVSTCADSRPIEHSHFVVLDLKTRQYRDLGDLEIPYAFIVLDARGRAYHPKRGGTVVRYDPDADRAEEVRVTVDASVAGAFTGSPEASKAQNAPATRAFSKEDAILNWDATRDGKTLYCVEMTTNMLYSFDLTAAGETLPGRSLGKLFPNAPGTDCRATCVGPDGRVWMAVTESRKSGGPLVHLVSYTPGEPAPVDRGPIGIRNPDYVTLTTPDGKTKPHHHTIRKEPDGTLTPWQPMGVCAAKDGAVYVLTIAPFTLLKFEHFRAGAGTKESP